MSSTHPSPAPFSRAIPMPGYARDGAVGVVHLGLGAFHRAHQALVFDTLLGRGDSRWGVLGVAMRNTALADALQAQDGLYTVQFASTAGWQWQLAGALWRTCVAAREPSLVIEALAAPSTRWVTLTVTEKGYDSALGDLLVQGLAERQAGGLPGLTIASCDNLCNNGRRLQALCLQSAQAHSPGLAEWIDTHCAFPNSMVDRIVPAVTMQRLAAARQLLGRVDQAALATETFWEWVIERRFADATDADVLAGAGVTVVDDVTPFEDAKLRLLNASHSAMACIGGVAGWPAISDCIAQPDLHRFIHDLMTRDIAPQLARPDIPAYRDALLRRFANPHLRHGVHQIATDTSQKIPQRWTRSVMGALAAGRSVDRLAFAAAAWLRYLRGCDELGIRYEVRDPMAQELHALAIAHAGSAQATVAALATRSEIWGEALAGHRHWLARITHWLSCIDRDGMVGALAHINTHERAPGNAPQPLSTI